MTSGLAKVLPWDSEFFGLRIAQVNRDEMSGAAIPALRQWFIAEKIDCAYCRVPADAATTIQLLQECGFRYVDIRITLARRTIDLPLDDDGSLPVRQAVASDLPYLQDLAAGSHRNTRFFADGNFPLERSEALYRIWIAKELHRPDGVVFTVESAGNASAYLSCGIADQSSGEIGLFAVGPALRGRGCGQSLLARGLAWFADQGCQVVRVPTQIANTAAIRCYEKAGFSMETAEVWLHWWSSTKGRGT